MRVEDLGEFGLIARLTAGLRASPPDVVVGIGDDAAAVRPSPGKLLLATCDCQVEGAHFVLAAAHPGLLGRKSLAVNLSDIAAMGGLPRFALVSLGIPPGTSAALLDELYQGLVGLAAEFGVAVVGGNVSRASVLFIDVTLLGEVEPERIVRRQRARPGDKLLVTGFPGRAAAGLALALGRSAMLPSSTVEVLLQAWEDPSPRVGEGRIISASGHCTAMIDVSDGLAADLGHLCEASRVGATVWASQLPIAGELAAYADAAGADPLGLALHGGEDYELLFTVSPPAAREVAEAVEVATGTPVALVGEVEPAEAGLSLAMPDGKLRPLIPRGFQHL